MLAFLFSVLRGALIGTGAILPGISGGVLCVVLGIYQPMMALLSDPLHEIKKRFGFFLPILIGFALGVLGLSRLVDVLFRVSPVPAVWLFIGLIAGTLPALWREAGEQGRSRGGVIAGVIALAAALPLLMYLQRAGSMRAPLNTGTWLLCGALWGVGLIVPGLSPSSLFILMGVYQPMAAGIADLSLPILLPMGAGLIVCVLGLSRLINRLLKRAHCVMMHIILGITLASTVTMIPWTGNARPLDIALYAACFVLGFAIAFWMDRVNRSLAARGRKAA